MFVVSYFIKLICMDLIFLTGSLIAVMRALTGEDFFKVHVLGGGDMETPVLAGEWEQHIMFWSISLLAY